MAIGANNFAFSDFLDDSIKRNSSGFLADIKRLVSRVIKVQDDGRKSLTAI